MIKARIFSVMYMRETSQYLVTLEEVAGCRLVPIWIGTSEGASITAALSKELFPRPLTHDLIVNIIKTINAEIKSIIISDLIEEVFFAKILLKLDDKEYSIDARPSDSLAIAIRLDIPVFIDEKVFKKAPDIKKPISGKEIEKFRTESGKLTVNDFIKNQKDGENHKTCS
ncbi:MAG: bifunctional nuclease family protein [Candidatus Omnitrophota bacterium]